MKPEDGQAPRGDRGCEDGELVQRALDGEERAYEALLLRYQRPVFSILVRMVRDRELAEDLAQEAFLRAFRALERYDPTRPLSTWLFRIAHNLAVDHLRRRTPETVPIDGGEGGWTGDGERVPGISLPSPEEAPDRYVENRELGDLLEEAIGRLRPEYRSAILLRHVEGCSYEEVAEILELPVGTVKTHLHRARRELRSHLSEVPGISP